MKNTADTTFVVDGSFAIAQKSLAFSMAQCWAIEGQRNVHVEKDGKTVVIFDRKGLRVAA